MDSDDPSRVHGRVGRSDKSSDEWGRVQIFMRGDGLESLSRHVSAGERWVGVRRRSAAGGGSSLNYNLTICIKRPLCFEPKKSENAIHPHQSLVSVMGDVFCWVRVRVWGGNLIGRDDNRNRTAPNPPSHSSPLQTSTKFLPRRVSKGSSARLSSSLSPGSAL